MRAIAVVMGVVIAALTFGSAEATVRIRDDMGGLMTEYASRFATMRERGEKVVIDGPCYSACTMLLGMLPRDQVCVTSNAVLGFHAAWNFDDGGHRVTSASATQALIDIYPPRIRSWIARRGGLSPLLVGPAAEVSITSPYLTPRFSNASTIPDWIAVAASMSAFPVEVSPCFSLANPRPYSDQASFGFWRSAAS
jgi:hypothetical protein